MPTQYLHRIALFVIFYLCGVFTAKIFHNPLSISTGNLSAGKAMTSRSFLQNSEPSMAYISFTDLISEASSRLDAIIEEDE